MNDQSNIFSENDLTPEKRKKQARINAARTMLFVLLALNIVGVIDTGTHASFTVPSLVVYSVSILLWKQRPFMIFGMAAILSLVNLAHFMYLKWQIWLYGLGEVVNGATIVLILLLAAATVIFTRAAMASRTAPTT